MSYCPIGYNILSVDPALIPHLDKLHPRCMFYMNAWGAADFAQKRYPDCVVIHRVSSADEDVMHRFPGRTLAHLQARAAERINPKVYLNLATEPQIPTDDDLRKLNDEQLKALQWAKGAGVRVAAPHLAHYGIDGARWLLIEPLIDFIADNPDLFLFTCDEYAAGHMFSGVVDPSLAGGSEVGHIPPSTWKPSPVPRYWHCGRITDYFRDRQMRGKPLPLTVITEHGLDALGDVTAWRNTLVKTPPYTDIRGWKSLRNQHQRWYPQWSAEQAFGEMLVALYRAVYASWSNILGVCIFCYGTNGDPQWDQFRVDNAPVLQAKLEAFQLGVPMAELLPIPTTPEVHARVTSLPAGTTFRNIRADVTKTTSSTGAVTFTAGADIGDLVVGDEVMWHPAPPADANGGWRYLRRLSDNKAGWVQNGVGLVFTELTYVPPTEAEWTALKNQVTALNAQITTLEHDKLDLQAQVDNHRLFLSTLRTWMAPLSDEISLRVFAIDSQLETGEG